MKNKEEEKAVKIHDKQVVLTILAYLTSERHFELLLVCKHWYDESIPMIMEPLVYRHTALRMQLDEMLASPVPKLDVEHFHF